MWLLYIDNYRQLILHFLIIFFQYTIAGKMLTDTLQPEIPAPIDSSLMSELVNHHFFKK